MLLSANNPNGTYYYLVVIFNGYWLFWFYIDVFLFIENDSLYYTGFLRLLFGMVLLGGGFFELGVEEGVSEEKFLRVEVFWVSVNLVSVCGNNSSIVLRDSFLQRTQLSKKTGSYL